MLGNEESGTLLTLLNAGDDPHQPLESIVDDFKSKLHSARHFNACVSLALILEAKFLKPAQRLAAFPILCRVYSSQEPSSNPFISMLVNAKFLKPAQRLAAFPILCRVYSSQEPSSNPFISMLVNGIVLILQV